MLENYSIAKIIDINMFIDVLKFRVTAFVLRFIHNVKKKNKKKIILKSHVTTIEMSEVNMVTRQLVLIETN